MIRVCSLGKGKSKVLSYRFGQTLILPIKL